MLNHGLAVALGSSLPGGSAQYYSDNCRSCVYWLCPVDAEARMGRRERAKDAIRTNSNGCLGFFIGELGDKTQLTAITLAADARYPLLILGNGFRDDRHWSLGNFIGKSWARDPGTVLNTGRFRFYLIRPAEAVPDNTCAIFAGLYGASLHLPIDSDRTLDGAFINPQETCGNQSAFVTKAKLLHDYYQHIKEDLNDICLGLTYCCACQENQCAVGQSKEIVQSALANQEWQSRQRRPDEPLG